MWSLEENCSKHGVVLSVIVSICLQIKVSKHVQFKHTNQVSRRKRVVMGFPIFFWACRSAAKELVHGWHAVNYHRPYGPRFCEGFFSTTEPKEETTVCDVLCIRTDKHGIPTKKTLQDHFLQSQTSKEHTENTTFWGFHPSAPHPPSRARRITACCEGPLGAVSDALRPSWLAAEPQSMARAKSSTSAKERKAAPTPSPRA